MCLKGYVKGSSGSRGPVGPVGPVGAVVRFLLQAIQMYAQEPVLFSPNKCANGLSVLLSLSKCSNKKASHNTSDWPTILLNTVQLENIANLSFENRVIKRFYQDA